MKAKEYKVATNIFLKTNVFSSEKEVTFSIGNQPNKNERRLS